MIHSQTHAAYAAPRSAHGRVRLASTAELPTEFGDFRVFVFVDAQGKEHVAMVHGDVQGAEAVATRIHSECLPGDVLGSLRCDCREQLHRALGRLATGHRGVLLYLRQEGRGIGLANKIRAYRLQEQGLDTVDANLALGFGDDERDYSVGVAMLRALGVRSIRLMTNNPDKVHQVEASGMRVVERLPHVVAPNAHNHAYLETKARRAGHMFEVPVTDVEGELVEPVAAAG